MLIAHVSDLHVMSRSGAEWRSIVLNKRLFGYATVLFHRGRAFRRDYLDAVLTAAARDADHVVVTGDITNLSLESEYEQASQMLDAVARKTEVTVVPGNHDIYVPRVRREGRFAHYFARFFASDLRDHAASVPAGQFPCVKLRGPAAIIGLSSAVPRPPLVSAGRLGRAQLDALSRILAHPEVARRTPVLLVHHDPIGSGLHLEDLRGGLTDARALREALSLVPRGLVLSGHLHRRKRAKLPTAAGELDVVVATSAALDHPSDLARAGYNLYEVDDAGSIVRVESYVLDPRSGALRRVSFETW